jgi:branched-chain amino acid transport system ATP-binding protein
VIDREIVCVNRLETGYGRKQVLFGADLFVRACEMVALIGHNGAGKTTLLKAIFGIVPVWKGELSYDGQSISDWPLRRRINAGIAYVPQGNRVFNGLTVRENLEMGGYTLGDRAQLREKIEEAYSVFPVLKERSSTLSSVLSGGEKQMLAIATGLMLSPRLLLLDEPSLGLSPSAIKDVLARLTQINRSSKTAMLIVEQKVREVLQICSRAYLLKMGTVVETGECSAFLQGDRIREIFL